MPGFLAVMICFLGSMLSADSAIDEKELLNRANQTLQHLKNRDFKKLSQYVHKDVTFSPNASVDKNAVKFTAAKLKSLKLTEKFTWGSYDGSGEPILLSVADYFKKYVCDQDFVKAPQIRVDALIKTGNTLSNIDKVFPNAHFVEYHFPGFNPEYEGIDWVSLRLLFEKTDGEWTLVGVVHDAWSI